MQTAPQHEPAVDAGGPGSPAVRRPCPACAADRPIRLPFDDNINALLFPRAGEKGSARRPLS